MKNLFVSAGLVAIGAASVQSALADATPKVWNVSASLRGFYDDNYASSSSKKGSFGIELSPSVSGNISLQQTDFGARYTYGLYWYQERQILGQNPFDQSHQLDLWLDHAFDVRWKVNVADTFAVGQEPGLLDPGFSDPSAHPFRTDGDNIANHFSVKLDTQWTRQFSTELHYANDFYDYQNSGWNGFSASLAGLLNRVDQNAGLDLQWTLQPETMAFVGYDLDWVDYIASEQISAFPYPYYSKNRDLLKHQFYVGLQHSFTANLSGVVKVGANYSDSYNDDATGSSWSPYANLSLTYTYLPGSYAQVGFTHNINATDVANVGSDGKLTQYQESSTVYASINHHFTDNLLGTLLGQVNYSDYKGGASSAGADVDYTVGVSLSYQFNRYFSADVGYNYDDLTSDIVGRAYDRNYVYVGVTATY